MLLFLNRPPLLFLLGPFHSLVVWLPGDYNPPDGFMLEWGFDDWQNKPSIVDCQDGCGEYNLDQRLDQFVLECQKRFNVTHGNDIMLTMGTDFTYANAFIW